VQVARSIVKEIVVAFGVRVRPGENSMVSVPTHWMTVAAEAAVGRTAMATSRSNKGPTRRRQDRLRRLAVRIVVAQVAFIASGLLGDREVARSKIDVDAGLVGGPTIPG
jgi:hypothetical protein